MHPLVPDGVVARGGGIAAAAAAAVLLFAFAVLGLMAMDGPFPFDVRIAEAAEVYHNAAFAGLNLLTSMPVWATTIAASSIGLWLRGARRTAVALGTALVLAEVSSFITKWLIDRPRPVDDGLLDDLLVTASFPSGHIVRVAVTLGVLALLLLPRVQGRYRLLAVLGLGSLLVVVGLARVTSGEHWPSDVLGGYLLAGAWLAFAAGALRSVGR